MYFEEGNEERAKVKPWLSFFRHFIIFFCHVAPLGLCIVDTGKYFIFNVVYCIHQNGTGIAERIYSDDLRQVDCVG